MPSAVCPSPCRWRLAWNASHYLGEAGGREKGTSAFPLFLLLFLCSGEVRSASGILTARRKGSKQ